LDVLINRTPRPRAVVPSGYPPIPVIHLAIRFALEIAMLAGIWMAAEYHWGDVAAILAVLAAMALWGGVGTPGDGSRGAPVVPTPGQLRLLLEIALFGIAAYGYWVEWSRAASETFLTISVLHYVITWERQWWLIRGGPLPESV
jgi:ribose/xylose/arabinose/galactoside ABC-type transport system permease subunit